MSTRRLTSKPQSFRPPAWATTVAPATFDVRQVARQGARDPVMGARDQWPSRRAPHLSGFLENGRINGHQRLALFNRHRAVVLTQPLQACPPFAQVTYHSPPVMKLS